MAMVNLTVIQPTANDCLVNHDASRVKRRLTGVRGSGMAGGTEGLLFAPIGEEEMELVEVERVKVDREWVNLMISTVVDCSTPALSGSAIKVWSSFVGDSSTILSQPTPSYSGKYCLTLIFARGIGGKEKTLRTALSSVVGSLVLLMYLHNNQLVLTVGIQIEHEDVTTIELLATTTIKEAHGLGTAAARALATWQTCPGHTSCKVLGKLTVEPRHAGSRV
ncbi:hypothetical protein MA16_Dca024113 [Dendrobium catenatum]|uniref:Uncharacterized protein n=1 Tax=Dendrobium catenatum TaxID=906689 RepID=A0A2I0WVT9_9ASPA|nr:hypothetical protein MA16_Dca024113 [Dendrobium catenatum]